MDELAKLFREQVASNNNTKIEVAKISVQVDAINKKLEGSAPPASTTKTTTYSTLFASTAAAIVIAIMEYFKQ